MASRENIVFAIVGLSDVHDGSVRVIPLTGGYIPKMMISNRESCFTFIIVMDY